MNAEALVGGYTHRRKGIYSSRSPGKKKGGADDVLLKL
jgi:hypothetical protein